MHNIMLLLYMLYDTRTVYTDINHGNFTLHICVSYVKKKSDQYYSNIF